MRDALYYEKEGYYRRRDVARWGRAGDYRTAPERTPLFAAAFARYFAKLFEKLSEKARVEKRLSEPHSLTVIEAGAGAGKFASDLLKTLRRDSPRVFETLRYVIDEASEDAKERASKLVAPFGDKVVFRRLSEMEKVAGSCIIFSNELIDSFPVHRVVMREGALRELYVGVDEGDKFIWLEGRLSSPSLEEHFISVKTTLREGQTAEVNLDACVWIKRAASVIGRGGGCVVTVDYGAEASELYSDPERMNGTLRGYAGHVFVDNLLAEPGAYDLTTTVDWTQMRLCGESAGLETFCYERLDKFLLNEGILKQLEIENGASESEAERASLRLGARELILPGGMCESFQVLAQMKL